MKQMNIYRISQNVNRDYDTYDSAIVAAENEDEASGISPSNRGWNDSLSMYPAWAPSKDLVEVEYLGVAKDGTKAGVLLASFNAG